MNARTFTKMIVLTAMFFFADTFAFAGGYDQNEGAMGNQVSSAPGSARTYPAGSPVYLNGKLSVQGTQMVNECGKPVQLKGMSSHGLAWFPQCYTEESLTTLVNDWHIDIFRLAVYTHENGGYCKTDTTQWKSKEDYNVYIDSLVDICGKLGIYCIIDWHVLQEGSGNPNNTLEDAIPFWDYMSAKHKDDKHVLYEICNEPNGFMVRWSHVKEYADKVIPVIRANDPDKIIICGTPMWSQDVDLASQDPLSYDNVMYTLHFYSGDHSQSLRDKADKAINNGLAIFVSEFGTTKASGTGGVFINECNTWMEWMNERKISWVNWSFSDKDESSAALQPDASKSKNWNLVSESGQYIKQLLTQPRNFETCDGINGVENNPLEKQIVTLYPNPTKDEFSVSVPEGMRLTKVQLFDLTGRFLQESAKETVDISGLESGVYGVKVIFSDGVAVTQVVKE